jgi:hypothetical protein
MLPAAMSISISSLLPEPQSRTQTTRGQPQTRNEVVHVPAPVPAHAHAPVIEGATQDETTRLTGGDGDDRREAGYGARESRSDENEHENDDNDENVDGNGNGNGNNEGSSNDNDNNNNNNNEDSAAPDTEADPAQAPNREQDAIIALTRRLRCMFTAITWPIVPLAVLVVLAFVYMIYGAILDWTASCSHPLHAFTAVSALIICYAPNHPLARAYLFGYHRDMDGPARPLAVRRYDQLVHTLALLYVYAGMTLDQTCREDTSSNYTPGNTETSATTLNATSMKELLLDSHDHDSINSCQATCPNLYPAVAAYVVTLEVLCWSLLVPLLCLPCIYLWFLRRASSQAHTLADFHDRLREDEDDVRRNGNILTETVMAQLQDVKLVRVYNDARKDGATGSDRVLIVPSGVSDVSQGKDSNNVLECCICMSDFVVQDEEADTTSTDIDIETGATASVPDTEADATSADIETGATTPSVALPLPQSPVLPETDVDAIVQTKKCGHIFHKHCMASWVGGQWRGATLDGDDSPRRARRTTCPLCRNDLR